MEGYQYALIRTAHVRALPLLQMAQLGEGNEGGFVFAPHPHLDVCRHAISSCPIQVCREDNFGFASCPCMLDV